MNEVNPDEPNREAPLRVAATCSDRWRVGAAAWHSRGLVAFPAWWVGHRQPTSRAYRLIAVDEGAPLEEREEASQRLANLAIAAEAVRHVAVPSVFDSQLDRPPFFLVQPWLSHRPLDCRLASPVAWTFSRLLWIARQIAEVVACGHERGRAHLALGPDHVLIDSRDRVAVVGWSRARWIGEPYGWPSPKPAIAFAAPEQSAAGCVTGREDVFSLGAVVQWMMRRARDTQDERSDAASAALRHSAGARTLHQLVADMREVAPQRRPSIHFVLEALLALEIEQLGDEHPVSFSLDED